MSAIENWFMGPETHRTNWNTRSDNKWQQNATIMQETYWSIVQWTMSLKVNSRILSGLSRIELMNMSSCRSLADLDDSYRYTQLQLPPSLLTNDCDHLSLHCHLHAVALVLFSIKLSYFLSRLKLVWLCRLYVQLNISWGTISNRLRSITLLLIDCKLEIGVVLFRQTQKKKEKKNIMTLTKWHVKGPNTSETRIKKQKRQY